MSWQHEILEVTVDHLVECNTPRLLAIQLQSQCRTYLDEVKRHEDFRQAMHTFLTNAERTAVAVAKARRSGRKTIRLEDLP